jgi:hypothetical protein
VGPLLLAAAALAAAISADVTLILLDGFAEELVDCDW